MVLKSHLLIYARVIILFKGKIFNLNAPIFYGNCHWTLLPCDGADVGGSWNVDQSENTNQYKNALRMIKDSNVNIAGDRERKVCATRLILSFSCNKNNTCEEGRWAQQSHVLYCNCILVAKVAEKNTAQWKDGSTVQANKYESTTQQYRQGT